MKENEYYALMLFAHEFDSFVNRFCGIEINDNSILVINRIKKSLCGAVNTNLTVLDAIPGIRHQINVAVMHEKYLIHKEKIVEMYGELDHVVQKKKFESLMKEACKSIHEQKLETPFFEKKKKHYQDRNVQRYSRKSKW